MVSDLPNALTPAAMTTIPASTEQADSHKWIFAGRVNEPKGMSSDNANIMQAKARATIGGGILVFTELLYRSTKFAQSKAEATTNIYLIDDNTFSANRSPMRT